MSRPLSLHVSALNDIEYTLYTSSIHDIVECARSPPPDYDKLTLGVREARAWLRGRYSALAPNTLDSILRLFSPDLDAADVLTGGQFFAALRLVTHVRSGKEMDPSLVFVQAHPDQLLLLTSRPPSPVGKHPRVPSPDSIPFATNGSLKPHATPTVSSIASAPVKHVPPSLPPKPTNPFLNRRASQDVTAQSAPPGTNVFPSSRSAPSQDAKLPPLPPRKPSILPPPRHASMSGQSVRREAPPPVPSMAQSSRSSNTLIQQSLQATRIAQSLKKANEALEQERIMEVLKSSNAGRPRSKSPNKDATSSASSATSSSNAGIPSRPSHKRVPSLPPRPRNLSPPASTVGGSVQSFEQVATAALSPFKRVAPPVSTNGPERRFASPQQSPSRTPPSSFADLPPEPPPTHPDRKPVALNVDVESAALSNTALPRVGRSKSLHQPSPPPVPPPRRKRPESAQLTPTSSPFESPFANPPEPESPTASRLMLSRHLSFSSARERADKEREERRGRDRDAFSDSPIGSIQKTLTSLQLRAQPALDVARYKTEGALSRRGFVQHGAHGPRWMRGEGEVRLMDEVEDGSPGVDMDYIDAESSSGLDMDGDCADTEERARRWREGGVDVAVVGREEGRGKRMVLERDDLKWPAGEGWRPL